MFDKIVSEALKRSLRNIIKESQGGMFETTFSDLENKFHSYINNEKMKLENKLSYFSTVKEMLEKYHEVILNLGYDYSLVKSEINYNTVFETKYFINGSSHWTEDEILDTDDKIYDLSNNSDLSELGIEISFNDSALSKGGECFIHLRFDIDNVYEFEYQ